MGRGRSRRVARMSVGALALMLTLGACSTSQWDKAFGFGWPEGITTQSHAVRGLWTWSIVAALIVGALVWALSSGSASLGARRGAAPADEVQPADRGALHGGAVHHRRGAVLLHRGHAELRHHDHAEADTTVSVTAFKWNWQFIYDRPPGPADQAGRLYGRHVRRDPGDRGAAEPERPVQGQLQRRDPLVLGAGHAVQAGRLPRRNQEPEQPVPDPPRGPGVVRRSLRRALRDLPLPDELRDAGRLPVGLPALPQRARLVRQRGPGPAGQGADRDRAAGRWPRPPIRSTPTGRLGRRPSRAPATRGGRMRIEARLFGVLCGRSSPSPSRTRCGPTSRDRRRGHRHHCADPLRRPGVDHRQLLRVHRPPDRPAAGGPARRGHRRGRRRAGLLQPGQLLADRHRAGRDGRRTGPGVLEYWLLVGGIVGVLFAVGGLLFEYYTRGHTSPTF